jgi:hypothetical protein
MTPDPPSWCTRCRSYHPPGACDTPTEREVRALEEEARRAREAARRLAALRDSQTGSIRGASKRRAQRKAAKASRRKNR